jgi:hypothetical protein
LGATAFDTLKINLFPLAKNKILLRLENIGDNFDNGASDTTYFDLKDYALSLY